MNICCVPDYWKWEDWKKKLLLQQIPQTTESCWKTWNNIWHQFLSLDFIYFFEKLWSFFTLWMVMMRWLDNARNEERKKIKLVHMCVKKKKKITIFLQLFYFWIKLTRLLGQRKNNLSNDLYFFLLLLTCLLLICADDFFQENSNLSKIMN